MSYLERSVRRFIGVDGGGDGRYQPAETIEECYETLRLDNMEKPDIEVFTKKVNGYMLVLMIEDIRQKRNKMLSECDWTQMKDVQLSDDAEWKAYRQLLRDLPLSVDVEKPVYPLKPGEVLNN